MGMVLVGIDGGSWSVLDQIVRDGYMPNLEHMIYSGVRGVLRSIVPPVTGGAWLSLATGLSPGKTGVVDFFKRVGDFQLGLVSSADYEGRSFWDYASYEGLRVGVLNYPLLYPPYPVSGFMVSGLGSPGLEPSTWPSSLREKLKANNALYSVYVDYHLEKYNDLDLFFRDVENHMRRYLNALRLLADPKLDLFVTVVQASDWVSHRLWAYIDENHPLHSKLPREDVSSVKRWIGEFWSMVDEAIGVVLDRYGGSGNVVLVSDHGFGPQYGVFNLARWLVEQGFMVLKGRISVSASLSLKQKLISVGRKAIKILPAPLRRKVADMGKEILSYTIRDYVDLDNSVAICLEHTIPFGAIYVLEKQYTNEIIKKLRKTFSKLNLRASIWRSEELYRGDKLGLLPDIIFLIEEGRVVVLQGLKDINKPLYVGEPYSPRHTGSHRLQGIMAMYGEGVMKKEEPIQASILDIAPTVMYFLNLSIPKYLDGNIIGKALRMRKEPKYAEPNYYDKLRMVFRTRIKMKMLKNRLTSS